MAKLFPASNEGLTLGEIRPMKKKQVFQGISETIFKEVIKSIGKASAKNKNTIPLSEGATNEQSITE